MKEMAEQLEKAPLEQSYLNFVPRMIGEPRLELGTECPRPREQLSPKPWGIKVCCQGRCGGAELVRETGMGPGHVVMWSAKVMWQPS